MKFAMDAIRFADVTKVYKDCPCPVFSGLSFQIPPSEIASIVGPSGVGKSSLLKLVAGIQVATRGQISVFGEEPSVAAGKGVFGYAFQEDLLLPWLTVRENISLPLEFARTPKAERETLVREQCARVHLLDVCERFPDQLSGGQRRRTALARATIHNPKVLLMDEPFSAVDEPLRRKLLREYEDLIRRNKLTAILVTHSVDEAIFLGDSVRVITGDPGNGIPARISCQLGVPFQRPRTEFLFRDSNFIELKEQLLGAYQWTPIADA